MLVGVDHKTDEIRVSDTGRADKFPNFIEDRIFVAAKYKPAMSHAFRLELNGQLVHQLLGDSAMQRLLRLKVGNVAFSAGHLFNVDAMHSVFAKTKERFMVEGSAPIIFEAIFTLQCRRASTNFEKKLYVRLLLWYCDKRDFDR